MTREAMRTFGARKKSKQSRLTFLPQWHVCATQIFAPSGTPIELLSY